MKKKLLEKMEQVEKELKKTHQPHHWNHMTVWVAYWKLLKEIKK